MTTTTDVYYDPHDVEIVANPLNRWPEWDIDYETAELAPTSKVGAGERLRLVRP